VHAVAVEAGDGHVAEVPARVLVGLTGQGQSGEPARTALAAVGGHHVAGANELLALTAGHPDRCSVVVLLEVGGCGAVLHRAAEVRQPSAQRFLDVELAHPDRVRVGE
jgi:hypothetical protein